MTISGLIEFLPYALAALLVWGAAYALRRGDELGRQDAERWRQGREDES